MAANAKWRTWPTSLDLDQMKLKREQDIYEILRGNNFRVTSREISIIYRRTGPQLLTLILKL